MNALEALVASLGILLAGFVTLPLAAWLVGAHLTAGQGAGMGVVLFVLRFAWLWAVRAGFDRLKERAA